MWFLIPLLGAVNIAIGGRAFTRGINLGILFAATLVGSKYTYDAKWTLSLLLAIIITSFYGVWRSQSPRHAELDLLWENPDASGADMGRKKTWREIQNTIQKLHGIPLVLAAVASAYYSLWTLLLPVLVIIPILAHLAVWNKTKFGVYLAKKNSGYPRRFGELCNGLFVHGVALSVLAQSLLYYCRSL